MRSLLLASALLCFPLVAQISDLQAQLQQANQIAALQAQLAAAKKPAPATTAPVTTAH